MGTFKVIEAASMKRFTVESIAMLMDCSNDTEAVIMLEDEFLLLQIPNWLLACEAPDCHVYPFPEINWNIKDLATWLRKYPLEDNDCELLVSTVDGSENYTIVGFTISSETNPPQVIFYTED
jgi:hypothetical protein